MNEVSETMDKDGFEAGYLLATEKLKEYPTCDLLVSNLAMLLDGALMLHGSKTSQMKCIEKKLNLYTIVQHKVKMQLSESKHKRV